MAVPDRSVPSLMHLIWLMSLVFLSQILANRKMSFSPSFVPSRW
jgi:hypothetical protein